MLTGLSTITDFAQFEYTAKEAIQARHRLGNENAIKRGMSSYLAGHGSKTFVDCPPELRKALGLQDGNTVEELKRIFDAKDTKGNFLLKNQGARQEHRAGWQFVLSASKELSVARALAPDDSEFSKAFDKAFEAAGRAVTNEINNLVTPKNHRKVKEPIKAAMIGYRHDDSRGGDQGADPSVHYHIAIANVGQYKNGKFGAIETGEVFKAAREQWLGQMFQSELARNLREMGYSVASKEVVNENATNKRNKYQDPITFKTATIEIGATADHLAAFSQRSEEIEEEVNRREELGENVRNVKAKNKIALETRADKNYEEIPNLAEQWTARARAMGLELPTEQTFQELNPEIDIDSHVNKATQDWRHEFQKLMLRHDCGEIGEITKGDVLNITAKSFFGLADPQDIKDFTKQLTDNERIRNVKDIRLKESGLILLENGNFTTKNTVVSEEKLILNARQAVKDVGFFEKFRFDLDREHVESSVKAYEKAQGFSLSESQRAAINWMTINRVSIVEGVAGAGKSTIAEVAALAYKDKQIIGLAPSGAAVTSLAPSLEGRQCMTVDSFIMNQALIDKIDANTVIFLDEAGMAGIHTLSPLMKIVNEKGAKLIAIGDERQIGAVRHQGGLGIIKAAAGQYYFLDENRRQDKALNAKKELGSALREGRTEDALAMLQQENAITECQNEKQVFSEAAAEYFKSEQSSKDKFVLVETNRAAQAINTEIRTKNLELGLIDSKQKIQFKGSENPKTKHTFYVGERLVFTQNSKQGNKSQFKSERNRGVYVSNSTRGTIVGFRIDTEGNAMLTVDIGTTDKPQIIRFSTRDYQEFQLGAACTKHKSQGQTVKDTIAVIEGSHVENAAPEYVTATRHKNQFKAIGTKANIAGWVKMAARQQDHRCHLERLSEIKEAQAMVSRDSKAIINPADIRDVAKRRMVEKFQHRLQKKTQKEDLKIVNIAEKKKQYEKALNQPTQRNASLPASQGVRLGR